MFPKIIEILRKYVPAEEMDRVGDEIEKVYVDALSDPGVVFINMMRGTIAKPSINNMLHLVGGDAARYRWEQSFLNAYTYFVQILDHEGQITNFACGQVHAEDENAAQEFIQDRVDMIFPECPASAVLLSKNHPMTGSPPFQIIDNIIIENPSEEKYG